MWTIVDREWRYGDTMCKLFKFFQTFGLTSSTYLVVAIALDRLWAIVTPLSRSHFPLLCHFHVSLLRQIKRGLFTLALGKVSNFIEKNFVLDIPALEGSVC